MVRIDQKIVDATSKIAKVADRKRMNYNFHPRLDDSLQRMLNAIEPGTYIQPHKHENPDKTEIFMVLKGRILVIEFEENGEIADFEILDSKEGKFGIEIPPRTWHTIISLEAGSVAYEIKDGPYNPIDDKNFASWAPKEGDLETQSFLNDLIIKCIQNQQ